MGKNVTVKKIETEQVREKTIDLLGLWRRFIGSESAELSQEEEISASDKISAEDKKALQKALKIADSIVKPTGSMTHITTKTNLKIDAKKSAQKALKEKHVEIGVKTEKEDMDRTR